MGRDITKTIIIDNLADNYKLQIEHGLNIKNFEGDENDVELYELLGDLKAIVEMKVENVKTVLPKIREKMHTRNSEGIVAIESSVNKI